MKNIMKTIIAMILISTLIGVASTDLAPNVPLAYILITCAIAVPIFLILLIYGIIGAPHLINLRCAVEVWILLGFGLTVTRPDLKN
jgi:hypothetical protein